MKPEKEPVNERFEKFNRSILKEIRQDRHGLPDWNLDRIERYSRERIRDCDEKTKVYLEGLISLIELARDGYDTADTGVQIGMLWAAYVNKLGFPRNRKGRALRKGSVPAYIKSIEGWQQMGTNNLWSKATSQFPGRKKEALLKTIQRLKRAHASAEKER